MADSTAPRFGDGFEPSTRDQWRTLAEAAIKGASFDKRLVSTTPSGLRIDPLHERSLHAVDAATTGFPGLAPHRRGAEPVRHDGRWDIRQRHNLINPATANAEILDDLEQGATSILLRTFGPVNVSDLRVALDQVMFDLASVALDAGPWVDSAAAALDTLMDEQGIDPSARFFARRVDPLGARVRHGSVGGASLTALDGLANASGPGRSLVSVDMTPWVDAGAHATQEIGWSLAIGVQYLRELESLGWSVDQAATAIEFTYAATADQFETIAKLRAARECWHRIVDASGGAVTAQRQHAMTPDTLYTRRDPWVNLLRSSTACFAAAVGGAESITVLPFDTAVGQPDELGRRTARNIALLLQEESHLGAVVDPGGGSWFVEEITGQLAATGWAEFQRIESAGGIDSELSSGAIATALGEVADQALAATRSRKRPITGVSEFADLGEAPLERAPWPDLSEGELPQLRPASEFEALRDRSDAASEHPTMQLVNLGAPAEHTARATFMTNALAAGGIDTSAVPDIDDGAAAAAALVESGLVAACICGSDDQYATLAESVASALKAAGAASVWLAGNPGEHREAWTNAGVDRFVHLGVDVVDALTDLHVTLGAAR